MAGARALSLRGCDRALVLAVDAPTVRPADLTPLLLADAPGSAYVDLHLPLAIAMKGLPTGDVAGWSLRRLIDGLGTQWLPCPPEAATRLRGANTPGEWAALLAADAG